MADAKAKEGLRIPGNQFEAAVVALQDFQNSNNISQYNIRIIDVDEYIKITFIPVLDPEHLSLGGKTSVGRAVDYYVSKADKKINRKSYQR